MIGDMFTFLIRKILIPFFMLLYFYQAYRNKKVTLALMVSYVFILFSVFVHTVSLGQENYFDFFDKLLILGIYPIGFLVLSLLLIKNKKEDFKLEKSKYIAILLWFIAVEILYILNIF